MKQGTLVKLTVAFFYWIFSARSGRSRHHPIVDAHNINSLEFKPFDSMHGGQADARLPEVISGIT